jgi:hypothetical protein
MTAAKLREALATIAGRKFDWENNGRNPAHCILGADGGENRARAAQIPIMLTLVTPQTSRMSGEPAGIYLKSSATAMQAHGAFVPDMVNRATYATLNACHGILVSGRFNGCDFALVTGGTPSAAHIYRDSKQAGNDPAAQRASFEQAAGVAAGASVLFKTQGKLKPLAQYGYVIGTNPGDGWQWHWLQMAPTGAALACELIKGQAWE